MEPSQFSKNLELALNGTCDEDRMKGIEWLVANANSPEAVQEALQAILTTMSITSFDYENARKLILQNDHFRASLMSFEPDDSAERQSWFTCLYALTREELQPIKERILAEFEKATNEEGAESCAHEGFSCLLILGGNEAAKALVASISNDPWADQFEMLNRIQTQLGEEAEEALWDYIRNKNNQDSSETFLLSLACTSGWCFKRQDSVDTLIDLIQNEDLVSALSASHLALFFDSSLWPQLLKPLKSLANRLKEEDLEDASGVEEIIEKMRT